MRIITLLSAIFVGSIISNATIAADNLPSPVNSQPSNLPTPHTVTQNLDGIAAIVNDEIITQSELNNAYERIKKQMAAANPKNIDDAQLKHDVLQQLIMQKLQLQLAKRANISITNTQVEQAIARIASANHLSVKQLESKLGSQGFTLSQYKNEIKTQMMIHQVQMSAVNQNIQVTQEDIQKALTDYKDKVAEAISYHVLDLHIPSDTDNEKALEKAKQLMVTWKKGQLKSSQATDLGWQSSKTLPTIFLDQLSHMKTGDIAGPIAAPNGFHIIKLLGIKNNAPAKMPTEDQIKDMVFQQKAQKAVEKWLKKMKESAFIQIPDQQ